MLYGRQPHLPIEMLFGLTAEEETNSPEGYPEKWTKRMTEAYRIASENSKQSSARGKIDYDRQMNGVVLHPGDRVLNESLKKK